MIKLHFILHLCTYLLIAYINNKLNAYFVFSFYFILHSNTFLILICHLHVYEKNSIMFSNINSNSIKHYNVKIIQM